MIKDNIIITLSGKAGAGKDTAADYIADYFYTNGYRPFRLAYANILKPLCEMNYPIEQMKTKKGRRDAYQELGTDVIRSIEPDFFVNETFHIIDLLAQRYNKDEIDDVLKDMYDDEKKFNHEVEINKLKYNVFIISDARFENELNPGLYNGYYRIYNILIDSSRNRRNLTQEQRNHSSESYIRNINHDKFYATITNDGTKSDLLENCNIVVNHIIDDNKKYMKTYLKNVENFINETIKDNTDFINKTIKDNPDELGGK